MNINSDDKRVCDNCDKLRISPGGCCEWCTENKSNPHYLTDYYFEQRFNGIKASCKAFKRVVIA